MFNAFINFFLPNQMIAIHDQFTINNPVTSKSKYPAKLSNDHKNPINKTPLPFMIHHNLRSKHPLRLVQFQ